MLSRVLRIMSASVPCQTPVFSGIAKEGCHTLYGNAIGKKNLLSIHGLTVRYVLTAEDVSDSAHER